MTRIACLKKSSIIFILLFFTISITNAQILLRLCEFVLTPSTLNLQYGLSQGTVDVDVIKCSWTAEGSAYWISASGSGSFDGTISYTIATNNTTSERTGFINLVHLGEIKAKIPVTQEGAPVTNPPGNPRIIKYNDGQTVLSKPLETTPKYVTYYWQGTSCGTSTSKSELNYYDAISTGTYYLRAKNTASGVWSETCSLVDVVVYSNPETPANPEKIYEDGLIRIQKPEAILNCTMYWQTSSDGTSTSDVSLEKTFTSRETIYLRQKNNISGFWSDATMVFIGKIYHTPPTPEEPVINYLEDTTQVTQPEEYYSCTMYWQSSSDGIDTTKTQLSRTFNSDTTVFLRQKHNNSGLWSDTRAVIVNIYSKPPISSNPIINYADGSTIVIKPEPSEGYSVHFQDTKDGTNYHNIEPNRKFLTNGKTYLRQWHNISRLWSDHITIDVNVYSKPSIPALPSIEKIIGSTKVSKPNASSGCTMYWQTKEIGTSTSDISPEKILTSPESVYLRQKSNESGLWSDARIVDVEVYEDPFNTLPAIIYFDSKSTVHVPEMNFEYTYYWQTEQNGTNTDWTFTKNTKELIDPEYPEVPIPRFLFETEFTEDTTLYLRAQLKEDQSIWSNAEEVKIIIKYIESLSEDNVFIGGGNETYSIQVNADCIWTISEISEEWITVTPMLGSGSEEFTIICAENTTNSTRNGSIKVGSLPVTILQFGVGETGLNKNWTESYAFDENENVIAQGKSYYDLMGKQVQSQSKNMTDGTVTVAQTVYDELGRAAISTLPAVVDKPNLNYQIGFITDNTNDTYSYEKFDGDKLDNPDPVSSNLPGSVGWYYSNNNTMEAYVPESEYPYSRVEYSKITGQARKSAMAGEHHKMGSGHETKSFTMPASQTDLRPFEGYLGIDLDLGNLTKTITVDPEDKISVIYKNEKGNIIATCKGNGNGGGHVHSIRQIAPADCGYVDIHLSIPSAFSTYIEYIESITNLETGEVVNYTNPMPAGFYRIKSNITDDFLFYYDIIYTHHAFFIYDKAGRLIESYSPKATMELNPELKTTYTYNSLGWLISSYSPDQGYIEYIYRKDGSIRFSQNSKQQGCSKFSFINYDNGGRVTEIGEYNETASIIFSALLDPDTELDPNLCEDVTGYEYDYPDETLNDFGLFQKFVVGKVSKTWSKNSITWYSYTYDSKIEWIARDIKDLGLVTIDYEYDFYGNVTSVIYDKGNYSERFDHKYTYDANLRLSQVKTIEYNADGSIKNEQLQAKYEYYAHGPLKRVEIAENMQGIDYVYNINGWLKSINHPSIDENDPGKDGYANSFEQDMFGMSLDYYSGDYLRSGINITSSPDNDLYDGKIKAQRWKTRDAIYDQMSTTSTEQWLYKYAYDSQNFLKEALFGKYNISTDFNYTGNAQSIRNLTYDANGNLLTLKRYSYTGAIMDDFEYAYDELIQKNQLSYLQDNAADIVIDDENLGDMENGTYNFAYNPIGQIKSKIFDGLASYYKYDAYGMVTGVYKDSTYTIPLAEYFYDDMGYRVKKIDYTSDPELITFYVSDASGTLLSMYTKINNPDIVADQTELPIYGDERLGLYNKSYTGNSQSIYELSDHLGNVRATFGNDASNNIQLYSYTDYYPYGMAIPGRQGTPGSYRFGYQGQFAEYDQETKTNQFEARLWDSRIGRWTSPDPAGQFYSPYLGMGNIPNMAIDPDGRKIIIKGSSSFQHKMWQSIELMRRTSLGSQVYKALDNSGTIYTIRQTKSVFDKPHFEGTTVFMSTVGIRGLLENQKFGMNLDTYSILGHELFHAFQSQFDEFSKMSTLELEKEAVGFENYLTSVYGRTKIRDGYSGLGRIWAGATTETFNPLNERVYLEPIELGSTFGTSIFNVVRSVNTGFSKITWFKSRKIWHF
ncbi:MAG: hypothetical protein KAR57_03140 [Bacteroidales bacterium]|nr:hypothetical protein [Bacteroidales bacterium]